MVATFEPLAFVFAVLSPVLQRMKQASPATGCNLRPASLTAVSSVRQNVTETTQYTLTSYLQGRILHCFHVHNSRMYRCVYDLASYQAPRS
jgi:hypothetical protein